MGNTPLSIHDMDGRQSIMLDEKGEFYSIPDTYNGKVLFRKMRPVEIEQKVARIVQAHPHPNVVTIYHVCDDYIDMELVTTFNEHRTHDIERAHAYFTKHNIVYMDWKPDNFGLDQYGITKVYDFDAAGIMDPLSDTWVHEPRQYYSYRQAIDAGCETPRAVDTFTFEHRTSLWHYFLQTEDAK